MKQSLLAMFVISIMMFSVQARTPRAALPFMVCDKIEGAAGIVMGNQCIEIIINKKTNPYANGVCLRIARSSNELGLECLRATVGNLYKDVDIDRWEEIYSRSGNDQRGTILTLRELSAKGKIQECIESESQSLMDEGVIINNDLANEIDQSCKNIVLDNA